MSRTKRQYKRKKKLGRFCFFFYRFPRYQEIQCYLRMLARHFPKRVRLCRIGCSIMGRDIDMVIVAKNIHSKKNVALIDAGIHGREWLTITTALCFIDHLVRSPKLLSYMDFYIIPCLNPDGYEYSHTTARMWRKNLNKNNSNKMKNFGVDINRNFPFMFGDSKGSSGRQTHSSYRGESALSEPEAEALARTFQSLQSRLKLYVSLHAYGNLILYPWGYKRVPLRDKEDLQRCGCACKAAMTKCGVDRKFKVGSISSLMYITSGCTVDYARGCHDVKFAYTIELEKCGNTGFNPTTKKILEIGSEVICGIGAMVRFVYNYYDIRDSRRARTRSHAAAYYG